MCFIKYNLLQCIRKKDFASEVRATLDVENFIERARLALDIHETTLDSIFDSMLHNLLDRDEPECAVSDAKRALFTQDSGTQSSVCNSSRSGMSFLDTRITHTNLLPGYALAFYGCEHNVWWYRGGSFDWRVWCRPAVHHLARTIQSSCGSSDYGFDYDQSWLCVMWVRCLSTNVRMDVPIKHGIKDSYEAVRHQSRRFLLLVCHILLRLFRSRFLYRTDRLRICTVLLRVQYPVQTFPSLAPPPSPLSLVPLTVSLPTDAPCRQSSRDTCWSLASRTPPTWVGRVRRFTSSSSSSCPLRRFVIQSRLHL